MSDRPLQEPPTSEEYGTLPLPSPAEIATINLFIKRLKPRHPLRIFVESWTAQQPVPKPSLTMLLGYLKRPRPYFWEQQTVALWLLGRLDWSSEDQILIRAHLTYILIRWRDQNGYWALLRAFGFSSSFVGTVAITCGTPLLESVVLLLFSSLPAIVLSGASEGDKLDKIRVAAVLSLGRMCTVEDLLTLLNLILDRKRNVTLSDTGMASSLGEAGHQALSRLVPRIIDADYGRVPGNTVPKLCDTLEECFSSPRSSDRVLNVVEALYKLGDKRALPTLNRIVKRSAYRAVPEAVLRAIQAIEERERQRSASTTLLRASDGSTAASDTLLRVASESITVEPTQLLRSSSSADPK